MYWYSPLLCGSSYPGEVINLVYRFNFGVRWFVIEFVKVNSVATLNGPWIKKTEYVFWKRTLVISVEQLAKKRLASSVNRKSYRITAHCISGRSAVIRFEYLLKRIRIKQLGFKNGFRNCQICPPPIQPLPSIAKASDQHKFLKNLNTTGKLETRRSG